jgi:epoxide hydrolase 4
MFCDVTKRDKAIDLGTLWQTICLIPVSGAAPMSNMQSEMRSLNGHPFHICSWGDPDLPFLLMLHGFPEYSGAWFDLAPLVADRFHVIAPDQRGYGQSWTPDGVEHYAVSALVSDMVALIHQLGKPVSVLGHDWGAAVAYGLAMFNPQLVDRLIIANGVHPVPFQRALAAGGAQSEASQYFALLRRPDAAEILAANRFKKMKTLFSAKMSLSWMTPEIQAAFETEWARPGRLRAMASWYAASPLKIAEPGYPITDLPDLPLDRLHVSCPHLLIWGDRDTALLPETTEGLEDFAPNLTRKNITDADHWLCHTHAAQVAKIIRDWTQAQETTS